MTAAERDRVYAELIEDEGLRLRVYTDTRGIETIGVGRNLRGKGISHAEALDLLEHDVTECLMDLASFDWFGSLDVVRQRAVTNFRFNVGGSTFRMFKHLIASLAKQDYREAASAMQDSQWYHQVQPSRRERLVRQIRDGQ